MVSHGAKHLGGKAFLHGFGSHSHVCNIPLRHGQNRRIELKVRDWLEKAVGVSENCVVYPMRILVIFQLCDIHRCRLRRQWARYRTRDPLSGFQGRVPIPPQWWKDVKAPRIHSHCISDNSFGIVPKERQVNHRNVGSQFSVFENHGSLASNCRAQKECVDVKRVRLLYDFNVILKCCRIVGDNNGYQETFMCS